MEAQPPEPEPSGPTESEEAGPAYECPNCGQTVEVPRGVGGFVSCPHCSEQFVAGSADGEEHDEHAREALEAKLRERQDESELDAIRIRQLSVVQRTAARTRNYYIVGMLLLIATAGQLIFKACIRAKYHLFGFRGWAYLFFAAAALVACVYVFRRVMEATREIHTTGLEEPQTPPDFSSLSDGSQHWKNLEEMK
jgi:ribosomal protein L37AE/L43A